MSIPSAVEIRRLVSGVTIHRTAGGGLVIETAPESASTLAALFSGGGAAVPGRGADGDARRSGCAAMTHAIARATLFDSCGGLPA
jgi:hypothetical protein